MKKKSGKTGFTLIELLVVISIIGFLTTAAVISFQNARAKARDARRKADLVQIVKALQLYYDKYGNYVETGSGCGSNGNGAGWFNFVGGAYYPASIASCLVNAGFLGTEAKDPTGGTSSSPTSGYAYMKYHCTLGGERRAFVFAKLETVAQSSTATDNTCCANCDSSYGMNYYLTTN